MLTTSTTDTHSPRHAIARADYSGRVTSTDPITWTHDRSVPGLDPADLPFAASSFDRDAVDRERRDLRAAAATDPTARVLVMVGTEVPVHEGRLVLDPYAEAPDAIADPAHPEVYLGRLRGDAAPVVLRSFPSGSRVPDRDDVVRAGLRALGTELDPEQTSLLVTAQAVAAWHRDHPRCPQCGTVTEVIRSGWARECPEDRSLHFPRTDPAVIVAITDGNEDPERERILLGRSSLWKGNRFSTLAGFVEPGESAEQAVVREIFEEAGIVVGSVHYQGSQPWPFPRSLMLGFRAVAQTMDFTPDGEEILDLRWFTRAELKEAAANGSIVLPGRISIAHALIVSWLGEPLPESNRVIGE